MNQYSTKLPSFSVVALITTSMFCSITLGVKGFNIQVSHIAFKPHPMKKYEVAMATMNSRCYFSITKHGNDVVILPASGLIRWCR